MKRLFGTKLIKLISITCIASMLMSSFTVFAADEIVFDTKLNNPNLQIPINEKIVMKNGTLVMEAEDMEFDSALAIYEDERASGGRGLKVLGSSVSDLTTLKYPSFQTDFIAQKKGSYNVWLRLYCESDGTNLGIDLAGKNSYSMKTTWFYENKGTYTWFNMGSQSYDEGKNHVNFKYRMNNLSFDKMIITSDTGFTPVGIDDVPDGYNADESGDGTDIGNSDSIKVYPTKGQHPRLFVTADDLPALKEKVHNPLLANSYKNIQNQANTEVNFLLPADNSDMTIYSNYDDILISRAFLYLLGEVDDDHARDTIKRMREFISTVTFDKSDSTFASRYMGDVMVAAACVYDWCYNLLTDDDKQFLLEQCLEDASATEVGYPPVKRGLITSHGVEDLIYLHQLSIAIAVYDEFPEWYDIVATLMFDKMIPAKVFLNSSGNTFSSWAYGEARNGGPIQAEKMLTALGLDTTTSLFGEKYPEFYYMYIYGRLPNGVYFKEGDDYFWSSYRTDTRNVTVGELYRYIGSKYDMPVIRQQADIDLDWTGYMLSPIDIIMYEISDEKSDPTELPLTRFMVHPMSGMIARTSWHDGLNAPTAMAYVNMRDITVGDHQHRDLGAFQIYYKGMLAMDSGFYQYSDHFYNYHERSVAHNTVLVHDPNEPPYETYVPDGGQKSWRNGSDGLWESAGYDVLLGQDMLSAVSKAKYAGPDSYKPEFSYISSDISSAYTDKVEAFERSCVFLNLYDEDYPAAFVVYDNLRSKDASFKKSWLLHSEEEPEVDTTTNTMVLKRTKGGYNGKLVNKTLIPAVGKGEIEVIGGEGKEFFVDGKNWPVNFDPTANVDAGNWRIEVSPKTASQEDKFLNVMYVQDADRDLPELKSYREFGSNYTGVTIKDRMVTFSTTRDNITDSVSLKVRDNGFDKVKVLLTDMQAGKWKVVGPDTDIIVESKADEYCVTFEGAPGSYSISPVNSSEEVTKIDDIPEEQEDFGDFYIRKDGNLMYLAKPTKLFDGVPYVAIDGIFNQIGRTHIISRTDTSITVENYENTATIYENESYFVMNGVKYDLPYPVRRYNGELYANLEGFEKLLSIKQVSYSPYPKLLKFSTISKEPIEGVDMTKAITPVAMSSTPHDGVNELSWIADRDMATYFCTVGDDCYVEYDLGEVYDVSKVMLAFFRGAARKSIFDILVSEDGVEYRTVYSGTSSGKTDKLEGYKVNEKARFVKVSLHGNDTGVLYNSIFEMFVIQK